MKTENKRQLVIALCVYLIFCLLIAAANLLNQIGERNGTLETLESLAGMLIGFVAFPIFCIGLPLWLSRRWKLEFSFWPRRKNWLLGGAVAGMYVLLTQEQALMKIAALGIAPFDFLIHFVSTTLFHVSYYPLFVVLLLPVIRKTFGLVTGLIATAALFALYHLATFYYFPAGLTPRLQIGLFVSFLFNLLLYLWTENLILVSLVHTIGGSVGLAVNDTLFNQVDEMLIITAVIMVVLFAYMVAYHIRHRDRPYQADWWLQMKIDRS
jgi:hypothetical protein